VFLLNSSQVITGTTTGKLVLWDCKTQGNVVQSNKTEANQYPAIDYSRQTTKMSVNRELTRATTKSSGSTRSGTLSSRKSSAKVEEYQDENEEDDFDQPMPTDEQQQQQQIVFNNQITYASVMNKRALKLCEPQKKAITVLMTTGEFVIEFDRSLSIFYFVQFLVWLSQAIPMESFVFLIKN